MTSANAGSTAATDPTAATSAAASTDVSTRLADGTADLAHWLGGIDPTITASWIAGALTALGTVLAVIVAARYAYKHAREHSKREHNAAINVDRLRREIDALERVWGLLAYMTYGENADAIVRYREDRQKNRTYYLQLANLRRFILTAQPNAFYAQHAGLHLPKAIRDELFDYVGSVMGLYLRYEDVELVTAEPIALIKPALIDKLRAHYHTLNAALKAELEQRYRQMLAAK